MTNLATAKQAAREQQADSDFERRFRDTKHLVAVDDWEVKKAMYAKGWCAALDSAGVRELQEVLEELTQYRFSQLSPKLFGCDECRETARTRREIVHREFCRVGKAESALAHAKEGL